MQIITHGGSIRRKELAKNLIYFLNSFNKQYDNNIKISIRFRPDKECDGSCQQAGNNRFLLVINPNLPVSRFIQVVIHEYTHIRQTYSDKCITDCSGKTVWRGKVYSKHYIDPDRKEYWLAPWEVEAVGMQTIMCDYLENRLSINLNDLTWVNCGSLITSLKDQELR